MMWETTLVMPLELEVHQLLQLAFEVIYTYYVCGFDILPISAPPSLTTLPPSSITVTWGKTFTLNCSANGSDLVRAWFHNGIWISSGSSITIENAGLSATGAYQCFVSNLAGNVSTATFVQVQSKSLQAT